MASPLNLIFGANEGPFQLLDPRFTTYSLVLRFIRE